MSATLDHEKFSAFLGNCPVFEIPGQCYPVKKIYCNYVGVKDLQTPNYVTRVSLKIIQPCCIFRWSVNNFKEQTNKEQTNKRINK